MACGTTGAQAMLATNAFPNQRSFFNLSRSHRVGLIHQNSRLLTVRTSSEDSDCNVEECAPEKEVSLSLCLSLKIYKCVYISFSVLWEFLMFVALMGN